MPARRPGDSRRRLGVAVLGIGVGVFASIVLTRESSASYEHLPADMAVREKAEIVSLVRRDGSRRSLRALSRMAFSDAWRAARNTRRQGIYDTGNQPNGGLWIHVGIADKTQSDGYQLTARYILVRSNGHWRIAASDL